MTHDYRRHGTTTLFAALDLLDGTVLTQCRPRHRHQEFVSFLRTIEKAVPADLEIHIVLDDYATHKHPKVKAWLAARPRWHLHFVPDLQLMDSKRPAWTACSQRVTAGRG